MAGSPDKHQSIPRPLVRTNQWVIVLSVLITWLSGFYWILLLPLVAGISGLVFHYQPIIRLAKRFLRKPASAYIPEDRDQQQFNQTIAVSFLTLGFFSYLFHFKIAAIVFTAIVGTAAFVAILGFCIGCFIHYQWSQYRLRKKTIQ
ncbi:DUF4395 domain-containing protein [Sporolactobacillus vineae]|uniref:DUF4395 domain-containing protein n=1 Tax=Sporolactobacillus vineae TaxID=444463 RepID=UPI000289A857|nr:DUF4395 domain-containing protein [Sporolactobacillus vineae]